MANNKENNDLLFIIGGGIAVLVAALFGVNQLKQQEPEKKECNKCPFSK